MVLKGFDISNWQKGMDVAALPADIIIVKATEGLNFVDKTGASFYEAAKRAGKLLGFYHFARNNNPEAEAKFFHKNTSNYSKEAVPILDLEDTGIPDWANYATRFVDEYHRLTGVWCMIYTSAGYLRRLQNSGLEKKCALWCAGYPTPATGWLSNPNIPYGVAPWAVATGWQFTSSFAVQGRRIDANYFYLDAKGWKAIATGGKATTTTQAPVKPTAPAKPASVSKTAHTTYTVKAGDTLSGIAAKYGTTWQALQKLNNISNPNLIYAGQKLVISGGASKPSLQTVYTVKSGDTLSGIAKKYGTTWQKLAEVNKIKNPSLIYPGQQIVIK